MRNLFKFQGRIEIPSDAPEKFERVAEGIESWLAAASARDLRREQGRIEFRGYSVFSSAIRRRMENPQAKLWCSSALRGIKSATLEFQNSPGAVFVSYAVSFSPLQMWLPSLVISFAVLANAPLPIAIVIVVAAASLPYLFLRFQGREIQADLRVAGIRGLTEGAAHELTGIGRVYSHAR